MPNWCSNRAVITGPVPVISKIIEILNDPDGDLLNWMAPRPKAAEDDWYNWNINNWGTKWPITDIYFEHSSDEDTIEFSFSSAWSPPIEAFRTWAEDDGRVTFVLDYWEPGCAFVGCASYDGDFFDDEFCDANISQSEYKRIASEKWGYEEWEEPEPLTEWYTKGVEDKGLNK